MAALETYVQCDDARLSVLLSAEHSKRDDGQSRADGCRDRRK